MSRCARGAAPQPHPAYWIPARITSGGLPLPNTKPDGIRHFTTVFSHALWMQKRKSRPICVLVGASAQEIAGAKSAYDCDAWEHDCAKFKLWHTRVSHGHIVIFKKLKGNHAKIHTSVLYCSCCVCQRISANAARPVTSNSSIGLHKEQNRAEEGHNTVSITNRKPSPCNRVRSIFVAVEYADSGRNFSNGYILTRPQ